MYIYISHVSNTIVSSELFTQIRVFPFVYFIFSEDKFQCRKRATIVSYWETVKDCFGTNDKVFLTRPTSAASRYVGYVNAIFGMSPYEQYWHHVRKITKP